MVVAVVINEFVIVVLVVGAAVVRVAFIGVVVVVVAAFGVVDRCVCCLWLWSHLRLYVVLQLWPNLWL